MQNGVDALPSIILVGRGLLVKMLITLEPHHTSNTLEQSTVHDFEKRRLGEQNFGADI